MIASKTAVTGGGKGGAGRFPLSQAIVAYDHTSFLHSEHALLLDFVNPAIGPSARVAVEMDIASGKALIAQIQTAIDAAEQSGVAE